MQQEKHAKDQPFIYCFLHYSVVLCCISGNTEIVTATLIIQGHTGPIVGSSRFQQYTGHARSTVLRKLIGLNQLDPSEIAKSRPPLTVSHLIILQETAKCLYGALGSRNTCFHSSRLYHKIFHNRYPQERLRVKCVERLKKALSLTKQFPPALVRGEMLRHYC